MIEEGIYSYISGVAAITAIVSTRIYPVLVPQNPTYPLVRYQKISGVRLHTLDQAVGMVRSIYQFDAWAETYLAAKQLSRELRLALDSYRGIMGSDTIHGAFVRNELDVYEELTKLHRIILEVELIYTET